MYTKWTAHCKTEHEKAQFEADLRRAKPVLERLQTILDEGEEAIENREVDIKYFESPSWAYLQAYRLGSKAMVKNLKKLIDLDKQKDTTNE